MKSQYNMQLFDTILEKEHYSEREAADTIRPIIDAINYCHSLSIIHRDIKVSTVTSEYYLARESIVFLQRPTCKNNKGV